MDEEAEALGGTEESGSESSTPEAPKSIREFVESKRAERAGTDSAPKQDKSASPKGDEGEPAEDKDEKKQKASEPAQYTPDELATELESKDLRELDPKRLPPELKKTLDVIQAAERRKHTALNAKSKELDDLIKKATQPGKANDSAKNEPEGADEESGPFTKEELRSMMRSKAGKAFLSETLQELGIDLDASRELAEQRFMQSAVADAASEYPELTEEATFNKVIEAIRNTPKWANIVRESKDRTQISLVFQAAAGKVRSDQADTERKSIAAEKAAAEKERESLKKQKAAANKSKPGSHAAGTQRKTTVAPDGKLSLVDFVREQRASRNSS